MTIQTYKHLTSDMLGEADAAAAFAEAVLVGLSEHPKHLPSHLFYDDAGSDYFQQITELEDYYPTRVERQILESNAPQIVESFTGQPVNVIDLGAGDGHKTAAVLEALLARGEDVCYVPIDISEGAMKSVVSNLGQRFPKLRIEGLVSEYLTGLRWIAQQDHRRNLVLFLGSNIGNFDKPRARAFLRRLWNALNAGDAALIGFDLKKDIEVLLRAYNDSEGVTAAFNLNLLDRINRELGGNLDPATFRHFGTYNVFTGAMESYLVSHERQTVHLEALQRDFHFDAWEPIHTEYSYKYLERDIDALSGSAQFATVAKFYDPERWFCDALFRVEKG
jgi:L-histidine N-alpha-methyltransferase